MAKSVGRNAPCPCGSGRKYKACCLAADQARERADRAVSSQATVADWLPPRAADPLDRSEDWDDFPDEDDLLDARGASGPLAAGGAPPAPDVWDRFEAAEYEEQIAVFREALAAGELDSELAFEMLAQIQPEAQVRGEQEEFARLVREYATRAPELYAPDAGYYVSWLVDAALAAGRHDELVALLEPFATNPVHWLDELVQVADRFLYLGLTAPLITTLRRAWTRLEGPGLDDSTAAETCGEMLGTLLLFDYLAAHPDARADDPAIQAVTTPYLKSDTRIFQENVAALLGTLGRDWQPRDFVSAPRHEPRERRLFLLGYEWLGVLWREHGVPASRARLAAETLTEFQVDREGKGKSATALLLPAPRRLDRFLARYVNALSWRVYQAGALVELLPLYLPFLVARGLVDEATARRTRAELEPVAVAFVDLLERDAVEPTLVANIRARWTSVDA